MINHKLLNNMKLLIPFVVIIVLFGCQQPSENQSVEIEINPSAEGFDIQGSDPKAIEIADEVMAAMGGRSNWDKAHFLCWNFFGARSLIWDKYSGDVRIDSRRDSTIYILNIHSMQGKVLRQGMEITNPDSLKKYLDRGKRIWINDSYWLVMPYKLKDSGVTLTWIREDTTMSGINSDVLELQFEGVGVTPDNKYEVWVDTSSKLVRQWAYYEYDTLGDPGFMRPWDEWEKYSDIMLSGNRGNQSLEDIMVLDEVPEKTFTSFDKVFLEDSN